MECYYEDCAQIPELFCKCQGEIMMICEKHVKNHVKSYKNFKHATKDLVRQLISIRLEHQIKNSSENLDPIDIPKRKTNDIMMKHHEAISQLSPSNITKSLPSYIISLYKIHHKSVQNRKNNSANLLELSFIPRPDTLNPKEEELYLKLSGTYTAPFPLISICFSPCDNFIVFSDSEKAIKILNLKNQVVVYEAKYTYLLKSLV